MGSISVCVTREVNKKPLLTHIQKSLQDHRMAWLLPKLILKPSELFWRARAALCLGPQNRLIRSPHRQRSDNPPKAGSREARQASPNSKSDDNRFSRRSTCHKKAVGGEKMSTYILVARDDNLLLQESHPTLGCTESGQERLCLCYTYAPPHSGNWVCNIDPIF